MWPTFIAKQTCTNAWLICNDAKRYISCNTVISLQLALNIFAYILVGMFSGYISVRQQVTSYRSKCFEQQLPTHRHRREKVTASSCVFHAR